MTATKERISIDEWNQITGSLEGFTRYLGYEPTPTQKDLFQAVESGPMTSKKYPRQQGTSLGLAIILLRELMIVPYSSIAVVSPRLEQAKCIRDNIEELRMKFPAGFMEPTTSTRTFLEYANGSKIVFMNAASAVNSLRGRSLTVLVYDNESYFGDRVNEDLSRSLLCCLHMKHGKFISASTIE